MHQLRRNEISEEAKQKAATYAQDQPEFVISDGDTRSQKLTDTVRQQHHEPTRYFIDTDGKNDSTNMARIVAQLRERGVTKDVKYDGGICRINTNSNIGQGNIVFCRCKAADEQVKTERRQGCSHGPGVAGEEGIYAMPRGPLVTKR